MAKKPCDCDSGKMTFEQWAAAGGAVPLSFKGREKAWANQVRKYAAGGAVDNTVPDMSDGGQIIDGPSFQAGGIAKLAKLLKGTQEVLPAAQREANLQRMLAESKTPMRLYHGTMATEGGKGQEAIRKIKPSREGALGSGVYLTPQSEFASTYAGFPARSQLERDIKTGSDFAKKSARQLLDRMDRGAVEPHEVGGNMLPVYAQIKNPLVLEGKGDPMIEALVKLGMDKDAAGKMVESAYERKGYIGKEVESRARAAGYDGLMQYRDGNLSEVVSYNPNAIKSATGNVGTFDVTKPDLSKADGGEVNMQAGGIAKLAKSLTGAKKAKGADKPSAGPAFGAYGYTDDLLRRERGSFASVFGVDYGQTLAPSFEFAPVKRLNTTEKVDEAKVRSLMQAMKESGNTLDNRIPPVVVDSAGNVLDGHHRVEAARRLGYDQVPVIEKFDRQSGPKFGDEYAGGGEVKMADGGKVDKPYIGYRRAGRRPESQQDREASANIPVAVARGLVSGTLGMPGDIESLARLPYELITGKESPTILPTSGDIEKRLPFRGASQTPVGQMFTGASQLAGGAYTGPGSGARAVMAVPKAVVRAGKDFVQAAGQPAVNVIKPKGGNFLTGSVEKAVAPLKSPTTAGETAAQRIPRHRALLEDPSVPPESKATVQRHLDEEIKRDALDQWIDRNLTNYIKKEMATPEDPVRLLIERRQAEVEGKYIKDQERAQRMADRAAAETDPRRQANLSRQAQQMRDEADLEREIGLAHLSHLPSGFGENSQLAYYISASRESKGFPREGMAKTPSSKIWENLSDEAIVGARPSEISPASRNLNPWIEKLDPNESVYRTSQDIRRELGFDHIVDVLRQDLAAGRINPDQLSKVSMEQAVRRTAEFDQDMAKKMREARIKITEGMPVHKEYPEGYKWVELTAKYPEQIPEGFGNVQNFPKAIKAEKIDAPGTFIHGSDMNDLIRGIYKQFPETKGNPEKALEAALKYEGDTMGHCVGGYCPDVLAGRSRIYSLRDAKGEPHVTVETKPGRQWNERSGIFYDNPELEPSWAEFSKGVNQEARSRGVQRPSNYILDYPNWLMKNKPEIFEKYKSIFDPQPFSIVQIKGKQNAAPKEEYLPFVQDFVRGGQWSEVKDFQNTGLRDMNRYEPLRKYLEGKGEKFDRYIPEEQFKTYEDDFLMDRLYPKDDPGYAPLSDGMKAGGEVKMQAGGIAKLKALLEIGQKGKGAKTAKVEHPLVFPRAEPKTREEIRPIAQRVAEQMTGEFVRQNPKVTTNPAGKSRKQFERERNIPLETRNVVPEKNVPPVDYEKLKDYAIVGVPGDPSMGGVARAGSFDDPARATVELTRVGDITPDSPVPLFGGPRYGDDEKFWASNLGAATPIQSNVTALSELYDAPVLGKYIKMAPDSANFAMHNLDSLLAIQRPEQLSRGKLEQLNRLIRKGSPKYGKFPGFPGFDDPVDVLLQSQLNSDLRKHIAETLTKPTITQALGLPNGQDVVAAITHPELRNLETGVSGFSIGRMVPGATLKKGESAHPTYDTDILGQLIGRSKYPTPYEIAFPDTTAYARSQLKPGVQEFNMMKLLGPRERIDQQYVDEMKTFEELMKQYTGKKKGGAVKSGLSSIKKV